MIRIMDGMYGPPTPKAGDLDGGEKSEEPDDTTHYRHYPAEDALTVLRPFIETLRTLRWIPRIYGDGRYIDRC
jgi:hypothetical protein